MLNREEVGAPSLDDRLRSLVKGNMYISPASPPEPIKLSAPLITFEDGMLWIKHPPHLYTLQSLAKKLGGKWNPLKKGYSFVPYIYKANQLEEEYKFQRIEHSPAYLDWRTLADCPEPSMPKYVKQVYDKLFTYQKEEVNKLVANPYGHPGQLLALSPGLGKTVIALAFAGALELPRVLVVAPISLLRVWETEFVKWFGLRRYSGPPPFTICHGVKPAKEGWVVTNYNSISSPRIAAEYWEQPWDLIILDESVLLKNRRTQRFAALKNLRDSCDSVLELSGSPITRHPDDLWAQFHIIDSSAFRSYWEFAKRFTIQETTVWGTRIVASAGRDLKEEFADIMSVRNQQEVLADLPPMRFQTIPCRMTVKQNQTYDGMLKEFVAKLESSDEELDAPSKLAQLTRLQQIASNTFNLNGKDFTKFKPPWPDESGKADSLVELFDSEAIELPALIWTHWTPGAYALYDRLNAQGINVNIVTGGMPILEVDVAFDNFKNGKTDVLICSLGVGKFGHTFTHVKTIVYLDKTWNADDFVQSIYRVQRIGLTHSPRVLSLVIPFSIDDMVEENLAGKMIPIANITNANLAMLLRGLTREDLQ